MRARFVNFIEFFITTAIVLVLIQTVLEDALMVFGVSWSIRSIFIYTGLAFDLLFTLEFLVRSWNALMEKRFQRYFFRQNGWVDLLASIPLLIFTSGPEFLAHINGEIFASSVAFMGMLKVVKAVRMARVLRLLRLLKIFQRIKFANSVMVQRHTVRVVTISTATLIFMATLIGTFFTFVETQGTEEVLLEDQNRAALMLNRVFMRESGSEAIEVWGRSQSSVLLIKNNDVTLYAREDSDDWQSDFALGEYSLHKAGSFSIWFDLRPVLVSRSRLNLLIFLSTLALVLMIMISYSPHFAMTLSDPVNVMVRGMKEKSYNLEVLISKEYQNDEIFVLADAYNNEYLPMKARQSHGEENSALDISLDDISDILDI